jgi:hypothetical protein
MNRVAWSGQQSEHLNEQHLLKYGAWSPRYFYDEFQRRAVAKGAEPSGYLSDDLDDDIHILSESYKEARD